jgi:capsular exopolysaccharide synthesis family protein
MELPLDLRPQDAAPPAERTPRLMAVINSYRRHLPLFLTVAIGVAGVIIVAAKLQTPQYTATASVIIAPHKPVVGADSNEPNDPFNDAIIDSQVEVLKSRQLAEAVLGALNLQANPDFMDTMKSHPLLPGLAQLPKAAETDQGPALSPQARLHEQMLDNLEKNLAVHRVAQTLVMEIGYKAPKRRLSAEIANAFANAYVAQSTDVKLQDDLSATRLLGGQIAELRQQVVNAETAVAAYKSAHGLLDVQGSTMAEQEIVALDQQLAAAKAGQAESEARLSTARQQLARGSHGDDLGDSLNSPVIQALRTQRQELTAKLADLQSTFGQRYPDVIAAKQQVADIDNQIDAEIKRIISNLEAQEQVAARRTASLQGSVSAVHGNLASGNAASVKLNELQRTADSARTQYEAVLNRLKETNTQASVARPDVRIANLAVPPPRPSSPKMPVISIIAVLLGFCAGVAAVLLRQELDTGLSTLEDVEGGLGLLYAGALPTLRSSNPWARLKQVADGVIAYPLSSFAEGYRTMAAFLMHAGGKAPTVIAVCSALPKEGKTVASLGLARVLSRMNKRVVLIDCDPRHPSISREARIPAAMGLMEVLEGKANLAEALVTDPMSEVMILPLTEGAKGSESPFARPAIDTLLGELRKTYDVVILDTAPILPVIDGRMLAQKADVVLLLVRWRHTPEKAARIAVRLLQDVGAQVSGVALSQVDLKAQIKSGYGDPTYYYRRFKSYYGA